MLVDVPFLDLTRAFDSVVRNVVLPRYHIWDLQTQNVPTKKSSIRPMVLHHVWQDAFKLDRSAFWVAAGSDHKPPITHNANEWPVQFRNHYLCKFINVRESIRYVKDSKKLYKDLVQRGTYARKKSLNFGINGYKWRSFIRQRNNRYPTSSFNPE